MIAFARVNSFASLVSAPNGVLTATHLPVVIVDDEAQGGVVLLAHMAKANPQWKAFDGNLQVMVIFTGPHSYISPFNYQNPVSVPTWNYVAVHMHGKPRMLESKAEKVALLTKLIAANDASYLPRFESLPAAYLDAMLGAIAAFEMKVLRIEGRFKLSQDKSEKDRKQVIASLLGQEAGDSRDTGVLMQQALEKSKQSGGGESSGELK